MLKTSEPMPVDEPNGDVHPVCLAPHDFSLASYESVGDMGCVVAGWGVTSEFYAVYRRKNHFCFNLVAHRMSSVKSFLPQYSKTSYKFGQV